MPKINNVEYLTLPQQVKKNKDDIADNETARDAEILALQEKDIEQDLRLDDHDSDIEQLQDAVAAGGVIVTRKIGLSADVEVAAVETKITFDTEVEASNEPTAVSKDANNDSVLITEGKYKLELPFTVKNTAVTSRTVTLNVYIKDAVALTETLLKTVTVSLTNNEEVNSNLQVDYTRPAGNNQIVIYKQQGSSDVDIKLNTESHVTSYFTVAGTSVVTNTGNIGLKTPADEALSSDDSEVTVEDNFKTLKKILIKNISSNRVILKDSAGIERWAIESDGNLTSLLGEQIKNLADPTAAQDAVTKAFMETVIKEVSSTITDINVGGVLAVRINPANLDLFNLRKIQNMVDPTVAQDAATKNYVDGTTTSAISAGTNITILNGANAVKSRDGKIDMNIHISAGGTISSGATILVLPPNYRPANKMMAVMCENASNNRYNVTINTDGTIVTENTLNTAQQFYLIGTLI